MQAGRCAAETACWLAIFDRGHEQNIEPRRTRRKTTGLLLFFVFFV
jgi:hypothetical protein